MMSSFDRPQEVVGLWPLNLKVRQVDNNVFLKHSNVLNVAHIFNEHVYEVNWKF